MDDSLLMRKCEQKKLFKRDGIRSYEWSEATVVDIADGSSFKIRCLYCHGEVRIHRQQVEHGPADHVEHRSRRDSEGCKGGHYFLGAHRLSDSPVD